jgi:hypothetical protein
MDIDLRYSRAHHTFLSLLGRSKLTTHVLCREGGLPIANQDLACDTKPNTPVAIAYRRSYL